MAEFPRVPTSNNQQYTLDAQIAAGASSLTLNQSVAGVVRAPGYVVVDRIDTSNNKTPTKREYKKFTGVSGANLTGLTNVDGTDQVHNVGAIVEVVPDVKYEQDWYDAITTEHNTDGTHKASLTLTSPVINTGVSGTAIDTDTTLAANSDTKIASQKAVKAYVETQVAAVTDWKTISATLTYSSTDGHTFVCTMSADLTATIPVGAKIQLTHSSSVKYFIVTAIAAGSITLYGGTDYTLAGTAITLPYFSTARCPIGFPMSPEKWTETVTDTTQRSQATPTNTTYYNLGTVKIDIPIGLWRVRYTALIECQGATGTAQFVVGTLSTANNSASDTELTCNWTTAAASGGQTATKEKILLLAAKTTYYLNEMVNASGGNGGTLYLRSDTNTTYIKATCAYL